MNSPHSIILGITGGIACGKTEIGRILSSEGFKVLDSDFLAHELMGKGRPVYTAVVQQFGDAILAEDGEIDRAKLGKMVFADPAAREELNRLVHPAVIAAAKEWIEECRKAQEDAALQQFKWYETVRDGVEELSPTKHYERISFALLGIKAQFADNTWSEVLQLKTVNVVGLLVPIALLLGASYAVFLRQEA